MPAVRLIAKKTQENLLKKLPCVIFIFYIKYKLTALAFGIVTAAAVKYVKYITAIFIISIIAGIQTAV